MNRINEIGNTKDGQEILGRTAERAYQRAQRTSGADKKRFMRTYNDAYKTGVKSSNKHLGGSREHFDNGSDYEYEKWASEHNGDVAESKTTNKKLVRLTESDLYRIVRESINTIVEGTKAQRKKGPGMVIENEARFLPHLKRTYENLRREYEYWQYANYKPQGMDDAISAINEAMHSVEDVIKSIEPSDDIPTWEDPQ